MYDPRDTIAGRASSLETSAALAVIGAIGSALALGLVGSAVLFRLFVDRLPVAGMLSFVWCLTWLVLLVPPALVYASGLRFQAALLRLQLMIEHNTWRAAEMLEAMARR